METDSGSGAAGPGATHGAGVESLVEDDRRQGLHVVVPLAPRLGYESVKLFSQAFVRHIAKTIPDRFSAKSGAANRIGKVYVDYLRNGKAQTTATAFSVRARPGMGVSMPVSWEQLSDLKSGAHWTVQTAREYLSFQTQDPWEAYWSTGQSLASAVSVWDEVLLFTTTETPSKSRASKEAFSTTRSAKGAHFEINYAATHSHRHS
jgi:DNA primase